MRGVPRIAWALSTAAAAAAAEGNATWRVIRGKDNFGYDIVGGAKGDVEALKALCLTYTYCAGFSSTFGLLKFNVSAETLGDQPNTDLWTAGNQSAVVCNASFDFAAAIGAPEVLAAALRRARASLFPAARADGRASSSSSSSECSATLAGCDVVVDNATAPLALGVDESYTLSVPSQGRALLRAATTWGALRGLETFLQMVEFESWEALAAGRGLVRGTPLQVQDRPRFRYRGLLVDTSRHFLSLQVLRDTLDAMSSVKLNTLHWHVVDAQAFPFNSTTFPELSLEGSYDPQRATYSHADVTAIVEYGAARGIRVLPEFDVPTHTTSWLWSHPELGGSVGGAFDPTLETTYQFLDAFIEEIAGLFPDGVMHFGGDELSLSSWNTTAIASWMKAHGVATLAELEGHFFARVREMAARRGKRIQLWHDPLQNGAPLDPDVTIQQWGGGLDAAWNVARGGHQVVYSAPYYLGGSKTWSAVYGFNLAASPDPAVEAKVLGAEACMWGESVDDDTHLSTVWPSAAAAAERFWGPTDDSNAYLGILAADRLAGWDCRARLRGLRVAPVGLPGGPYYCAPDARQWRSANPRHRAGPVR